MILMVHMVVMAFLSPYFGMSNELDYGNWNYREGDKNVNVANIRSVTRVLDAWGKRIFKDIKTLLHSQPNALLPDYSRVRPLSESLNDLFREVFHLQRRITDLNNRLATLEPFLRHHGYRKEGEEGGDAKELAPQSVGPSQAKYPRQYVVRVVRPVNRVVRTRQVKVFKNENGRVKASESER
uniref:Si:ch211-243a20.3 n=1 Tax=Sinocyclocheilus grahami TaxID=75366 RepID=A0A672NM68_SINGR